MLLEIGYIIQIHVITIKTTESALMVVSGSH
jgi:hypothetical protein